MQVIVLVSKCAQKVGKQKKWKIAGEMSEIAVLLAWELDYGGNRRYIYDLLVTLEYQTK